MPDINSPDEPKDIKAIQLGSTADKALINFMKKFTNLLKVSAFIYLGI